MTDQAVPKGEFARIIGVTPGRVSQYIAAGKIGPDALDGEGRSAKVYVEKAKAQLKERLDLGQRLGNGLDTRLEAEPPTAAAPDALSPTRPPAGSSGVEEELKLEKLHAARFARRKREEEELERRGLYMRASEAREQMVRVAADTLGFVEGGLADLAAALAARFELPQRDVLHELRLGLRRIREKATESARRKAQELPGHVTDVLPDHDEAA